MQGRISSIALLGAALAWTGGTAAGSARAEFLSDLIAKHGSITAGTEVFDQFSYQATGEMPSASKVGVSVITDPSGHVGLRFTGGFTDAPEAHGPQQASDAVLSYRVTALGNPIDGLNLFGNPLVIGGRGVISATETFQVGTVPYQMDIHDGVKQDNGPHDTKLSDSVAFAPAHSIQVVTKDLLALSLGGFPTLSFVDQTFSQSIPEPGSVVLAGVGLLALAGYRRYHHRTA